MQRQKVSACNPCAACQPVQSWRVCKTTLWRVPRPSKNPSSGPEYLWGSSAYPLCVAFAKSIILTSMGQVREKMSVDPS